MPREVKLCFWLALLAGTEAVFCEDATATVITASYSASLSVHSELHGLTNGVGNVLTTVPSGLSIVG